MRPFPWEGSCICRPNSDFYPYPHPRIAVSECTFESDNCKLCKIINFQLTIYGPHRALLFPLLSPHGCGLSLVSVAFRQRHYDHCVDAFLDPGPGPGPGRSWLLCATVDWARPNWTHTETERKRRLDGVRKRGLPLAFRRKRIQNRKCQIL